MKTLLYRCVLLLVWGMFYSCTSQVEIPVDAISTNKTVQIYPDYTNIVIPPNIAPLNFLIKSDASEYIVEVKGVGDPIVVPAQKDGVVQFDIAAWKELLNKSKGRDLTYTIYEYSREQWRKYPSYKVHVAKEAIDTYLSYRLIEPGYELYRQVGLYQRNLTDFDESAIYENNRQYKEDDNHCVNCHNYQNYHANNMLFHVRANHGGTVLALNGNIKKMNMTNESILSSAVYPSWHPRHNWLVFSTNKTGQTFHMHYKEKVEVIDSESDLIFYDADKNSIKNILKTKDKLETFPCWNPKGDKIYFCSADVDAMKELPDSLKTEWTVAHYNKLYYNIMSMSFDSKTKTFGSPVLEVACNRMKKSASVPRISPNGRFLLFTLGDYGQFHIWHKSADLYVKDLQTGVVRRLNQANSKDVDSYHTWSSNGRWIVFSSRRDDGNYTRLYIAYFDEKGRDFKAFLLPQTDPIRNIRLLKSYNVPELTVDKVPYTPQQFKDVIYNTESQPVQYSKK